MTNYETAYAYLNYLEKGETAQIIHLFHPDGVVESPLYGTKNATDFYTQLATDTHQSIIHIKGIYEKKNASDVVLYFTYEWTLKNNQKTTFDVVDIIEFDAQMKIKKLKIIYDTAQTKKLLKR